MTKNEGSQWMTKWWNYKYSFSETRTFLFDGLFESTTTYLHLFTSASGRWKGGVCCTPSPSVYLSGPKTCQVILYICGSIINMLCFSVCLKDFTFAFKLSKRASLVDPWLVFYSEATWLFFKAAAGKFLRTIYTSDCFVYQELISLSCHPKWIVYVWVRPRPS